MVGVAQDVLACIELDVSELKTRVTVLRRGDVWGGLSTIATSSSVRYRLELLYVRLEQYIASGGDYSVTVVVRFDGM